MQAPHSVTVTAAPGTQMLVRSGAPRPRTGTPIARVARQPVGARRRPGRDDINFRPDCNSAPGLGFDAVHQAATCGTGVAGSRRRGFVQTPLFFPFFDGGFFLPGSAVPAEEASTADNSQPDATDAEMREARRRYRATEPAPAQTVESASSAAPESEEFVFVRRDGTVFFAVAYSWDNGTLRYITSQGVRQTVTQDALDLGATQQFNVQRGLNFRSPA
jgi:hypothetical protein